MKNLLLMRHAKSSWKDASVPDHQRPLNQRGKSDAPLMGKYLREQGILLDALLCSTAVRARETAGGLLQEYTFEGEVVYMDDLYHASPETLIALLKQLPDRIFTAMVIAHNPGLEIFLETVCAESEHMPTASVASVKFSFDHWADWREDAKGELLQLWRPREL
jgi:phosphohistidine phosphatase